MVSFTKTSTTLSYGQGGMEVLEMAGNGGANSWVLDQGLL